jgi:hypothetical protein
MALAALAQLLKDGKIKLPDCCDLNSFKESLSRGAGSPDFPYIQEGWMPWARVNAGVDEVMEPVYRISGTIGGAIDSGLEYVPGYTGIRNWWQDNSVGKPVMEFVGASGTALYKTHFGENAWQHGMKAGNMTGPELQNKLREESAKLIEQYQTLLDEGKCEEAAFALGQALHYMQDTYSPSHVIRDANGIKEFLDYNKQSAGLHAGAEDLVKNPGLRDSVTEKTVELIKIAGPTPGSFPIRQAPGMSGEALRQQLGNSFFSGKPEIGGAGPELGKR